MIPEYEAAVLAFIGYSVIEAAKVHAISQFPKESCGFVAGGVYVACENTNADPLKFFTIDDPRYEAAVASGALTAIIHSHPNGPLMPSELDMTQQIATNVPWFIITLNETGVHKLIAWGGNLPIAPLISRPFVHGIFDCYSIIRDAFRLGKDALLTQGVHWPLPPIALPEVARADVWWTGEADLYSDHLEKVGFRKINRGEARAGDGFLCALGDIRANPKQRLNHAAILLEYDQILHQLPTRPSARGPAGVWVNGAVTWVRYEGPTS